MSVNLEERGSYSTESEKKGSAPTAKLALPTECTIEK